MKEEITALLLEKGSTKKNKLKELFSQPTHLALESNTKGDVLKRTQPFQGSGKCTGKNVPPRKSRGSWRACG